MLSGDWWSIQRENLASSRAYNPDILNFEHRPFEQQIFELPIPSHASRRHCHFRTNHTSTLTTTKAREVQHEMPIEESNKTCKFVLVIAVFGYINPSVSTANVSFTRFYFSLD
jgi:hypothetical protein